MTTQIALTLLAATLGASLLAGCQRPQAPAAPTAAAAATPARPASAPARPLPVACQLVTAESASTVLGQPASLMADNHDHRSSMCVWVSSGAPGRIAMLSVNVIPNASADDAGELFTGLSGLQSKLVKMVNDQAGLATRKSGREIEGLGDEAWQSSDAVDLIGKNTLVVRKGTLVLNVAVTGMTRGDGLGAGLPERLRQATASAVGQM